MKKKIFIIIFLVSIFFNSFAFPSLSTHSKKGTNTGRRKPVNVKEIPSYVVVIGLTFADAIENYPYIDPATAKSDGTIILIGDDCIIVLIDGDLYVSKVN